MRAVLLGIVEGNPTLCVFTGRDHLSKKEQGRPQRHVSFQKEGRVLHFFG